MGKNKIYDSGNQVKNLAFVVLCRNNEEYLKFLIPRLKMNENYYDVNFYYLFIENGSKDETPHVLREFMEDRNGLLVNPGNSTLLDKKSRITRISELRNISKSLLQEIKFDWVVLLDSDIYFDLDFLLKLFELNPTKNYIGMLCSYGVAAKKDITSSSWLTLNHYYDTATFLLDEDYKSTWPHCNFLNCIECSSQHKKAIDTNANNLLNVYSAFGGLALINEAIIRNPLISWKPIIINESPLNEHLNFCRSIHDVTDYKIAIALKSKVYWDISTLNL